MNLKIYLYLFIIGGIAIYTSCNTAGHNNNTMSNNYFVVGTFTEEMGWVHGKADGFYVCKFNEKDTSFEIKATLPEVINPSYIIANNVGNMFYVAAKASVHAQDQRGTIEAFRFRLSGMDIEKVSSVSSNGVAPCYIAIDEKANMAYVANYGGGISVNPLDTTNQAVREKQQRLTHEGRGAHPRQDASHPHMIDMVNNFVVVTDLGTNKVYKYVLMKNNTLELLQAASASAPDAGPRHFAYHPLVNKLYTINELNNSIDVFDFDSLNLIATYKALPDTFAKTGTGADIQFHPNYNTLYVSTRGDANTVSVFSVKPDGTLQFEQFVSSKGKTPRNFNITPSGKFLLIANQDSDNIVCYAINDNGTLHDTGFELAIPTPVCISFIPTKKGF